MQEINDTTSQIKPLEDVTLLSSQQQQPLRERVLQVLQNYFTQLGETAPSNLYELVLAEVEAPMLEVVMQKTRGNQKRAAIMLGISRGTLRKLLKKYNLD
jgi:DNA-binding protein Fis